MHIRTQTHTQREKDRKDWNTGPMYKRAWHSGQSLEYVTWSSSLGRKMNAHQTSLSSPVEGREDLQEKGFGGGEGREGGRFLPHLPQGPWEINSHNLVLIRHSSIAGARN